MGSAQRHEEAYCLPLPPLRAVLGSSESLPQQGANDERLAAAVPPVSSVSRPERSAERRRTSPFTAPTPKKAAPVAIALARKRVLVGRPGITERNQRYDAHNEGTLRR